MMTLKLARIRRTEGKDEGKDDETRDEELKALMMMKIQHYEPSYIFLLDREDGVAPSCHLLSFLRRLSTEKESYFLLQNNISADTGVISFLVVLCLERNLPRLNELPYSVLTRGWMAGSGGWSIV
jgi:hypothetical protein